MLAVQANTLNAIFNNLAGNTNNAEYISSFDRYLKLALRAQSQCRATCETLATAKNPPMVGYVKQANSAPGPQQVNNATTSAQAASPAPEHEKLPNELLEANDGKRLDCASGAHDKRHSFGIGSRGSNQPARGNGQV
jgi:hypothetical protein